MNEANRPELEHYRQIIAQSRDPVTVVDRNYAYLLVNDAYCRLHRQRAEEIIGKTVEAVVGSKNFHSRLKEFLDRGLAGENFFIQAWFDLPEAGRRFMEVSYSPVSDDQGTVTGVAVLLHDTTLRKKLQEEQTAALETTRALLNTPDDFFLLIEPDGTIVDCNTFAAKSLASSTEDLTGKLIWDFLPAELAENKQKYVQTVCSTGKPVRHEIAGDRLYLDVTLHPILDQANRVQQIVIMTRDITGMKRMEKQLKQRAQELNEVNLALETLLDQSTRTITDQENRIYDNLQELVFPYLYKLEEKLAGREELLHLNVVKANLEKITSTFILTISSRLGGLTPRELQVAQLIKQGKATKDIALLLHISPRTVEFYRDKLRKKLGLKSKRINLRSHLSSLA
jgi:PAS domain S-box-containing protein